MAQYIEKTDAQYPFCLHESVVVDAEFINHELVLSFLHGFIRPGDDGALDNCKLRYRLDTPEDEELNVYINAKSRRVKAIKFSKFREMLKRKGGLIIYQDYRGTFTNDIMISGYLHPLAVEIYITGVKEMVYEFTE